MHTVCFACLFFPKQLPWVVQWSLDAEVRQGAQTNGVHCTRAGTGEVGEEAKANSGSRQSKDRPLGGAGNGAHGWFGYKTMEDQPVGAFRSYNLLKMSGWQACVAGSRAHPVSAMISGAT